MNEFLRIRCVEDGHYVLVDPDFGIVTGYSKEHAARYPLSARKQVDNIRAALMKSEMATVIEHVTVTETVVEVK